MNFEAPNSRESGGHVTRSNGALTGPEWQAFLAAPSWDSPQQNNRYEGVSFLLEMGRTLPEYRHKAGAACLLGFFTNEMVAAIARCAVVMPDEEVAKLALEGAGAILSLLPPGRGGGQANEESGGETILDTDPEPVIEHHPDLAPPRPAEELNDLFDCLDLAIVALEASEFDTAKDWLERFANHDRAGDLHPFLIDPHETIRQAIRYLEPQPNLVVEQLQRVRGEISRALGLS